MTQEKPSEKWTKKPITIDAVQITKDVVLAHLLKEQLLPFGLQTSSASWNEERKELHDFKIYIETYEGRMEVSENDYVIKGIKGELYPCKPDIFEASYTRALTPDKPVDDADFPTGAVENGRAFFNNVAVNYGFKDIHGHTVGNCYDFQQAIYCFEELVRYATAKPCAEKTVDEFKQLLMKEAVKHRDMLKPSLRETFSRDEVERAGRVLQALLEKNTGRG